MMPTRCASSSASSRYCVVRKMVMPSSVLSARTSSHTVARLTGSRPVVGSSRNSTSGLCTSAAARSSLRFMPPLYVAMNWSSASPMSTRPERSATRRSTSFGWSPYRRHCRRRSSRPVCLSSSAASCSATPMRSRTRSGSSGDVVAGDGRASSGRLQERAEHPHDSRLARAVRAQEPVDLALRDLEVDPVDRSLVPERPHQAPRADGRGRVVVSHPAPGRPRAVSRTRPRRG